MLEKEKLDRLNELARLAKQRPLTTDEKSEQTILRTQYLERFRATFRDHLDHIHVEPEEPKRPNGNQKVPPGSMLRLVPKPKKPH